MSGLGAGQDSFYEYLLKVRPNKYVYTEGLCLNFLEFLNQLD